VRFFGGSGCAASPPLGPRPFGYDSMRQRALDLAHLRTGGALFLGSRGTPAEDLFVTNCPIRRSIRHRFAVMAAGRRSVCSPGNLFAPSFELAIAHRLNTDTRGSAGAAAGVGGALHLRGETTKGANAYVILPNEESVASTALHRDSVGETNTFIV